MMLVLEGLNGAGKSTVADHLSRSLGLRIFRDEKRGAQHAGGRPENLLIKTPPALEWVLTGSQASLDVAAFSRLFHFLADRWAMTNWVFDGIRGVRASPDFYRNVCSAASAKIFLFDVDASLAHRRVSAREAARGERCKYEVSEMEAMRVHYLKAAETFRDFGVPVHVVSVGDRLPREVAAEVEKLW